MEHVALTPAHFQELLDGWLSNVPTIVKGLVTTATEGLTEQANTLVEARATSDHKTDRHAESVCMMERLWAQEAQTQEREKQLTELERGGATRPRHPQAWRFSRCTTRARRGRRRCTSRTRPCGRSRRCRR